MDGLNPNQVHDHLEGKLDDKTESKSVKEVMKPTEAV